MDDNPTLRRVLSLPLLVLYGLGTTIGAGIYALTGAVAQSAGMLAFVSFGAAALLAGFSGASYAALSSRFPQAAAQAAFVRAAFGRRNLATGLGLVIALSGAVSAATVSNGFVGYLNEVVDVPSAVGIVGILCLLGGVAALGVRQSVAVASVVTVIEIGGLLLVLGFAAPVLTELPARLGEFAPGANPGWAGVFTGTFLAFYAFLGFEDMVNVGEETTNVQHTLPLAIALTLGITFLLYALLAVVAVLAVPPEALAASDAPLALLFEESGGRPEVLGLIGVLAMLNGALIQIIMASRIIFGLARDGAFPSWFAGIQPRTGTPIRATVGITVLVAALALSFPLAPLAQATSLLTLGAFVLVNASLFRIQQRDPAPEGVLVIPQWLPVVGMLVSAGMLAARLFMMPLHS